MPRKSDPSGRRRFRSKRKGDIVPKPGKPGEWRPLGIPAVYDRVCQQALLNRLEPIYEPVFDDSSFGYRPGRSAKDALRKVWGEIEAGAEWIVDADLRDYFGTLDHEKLMTLVARRVADGRVLTLIEQMLQAGYIDQGRLFPTPQGTPQGGVVSPLLSNILLTPFDREIGRRGYQLTRYADDVAHCKTEEQAQQVLESITRRLEQCRLEVHPEKTRIVYCKDDDRTGRHPTEKSDFLGYTFRPRRAKNRWEKLFVSFTPAVSNAAARKMRQEMRRWRIPLRSDKAIDDLARMWNDTEGPMGSAERGNRGNGQSAPGPAPRIGRKDLQDPDRDVPEPDWPAPDGERERSDRDADGRPVQLEIPTTGQRVAGE